MLHLLLVMVVVVVVLLAQTIGLVTLSPRNLLLVPKKQQVTFSPSPWKD